VGRIPLSLPHPRGFKRRKRLKALIPPARRPPVATYVEPEVARRLARVQWNYREIAEMLSRGYAAVCEGMTRRQAHYARRRLRQLLGEEVLVLPYEVEGGREGYIIIRLRDFAREAPEPGEG